MELIVRKKIPGQRGYEYFLTRAGKDTLPLLKAVGEWGMQWARGDLRDSDFDVELLMLYLQRSIKTERLPGNQSVIRFKFTNLRKLSSWWLVVKGDTVDVCLEDPGQEIDVYFTTEIRTMVDCWMGDKAYGAAIKDGSLRVTGSRALTRHVQDWMSGSMFADIRPAHEI